MSFVVVFNPNVTGSDVSVAVGSPAVLTCSVSDNPNGTTITYQWKRNSMTVNNSTTYQVSSSVGVEDAGVYTCEVTVSDSSDSSHVISGSGSAGATSGSGSADATSGSGSVDVTLTVNSM